MIFVARKSLGWGTEEFFNSTPVFFSRMLDIACESRLNKRRAPKRAKVRTAEDFRRMP